MVNNLNLESNSESELRNIFLLSKSINCNNNNLNSIDSNTIELFKSETTKILNILTDILNNKIKLQILIIPKTDIIIY